MLFLYFSSILSIAEKFLGHNLHVASLADPSLKLSLNNGNVELSPASNSNVKFEKDSIIKWGKPSKMEINGTKICHRKDKTLGACTGNDRKKKFFVKKGNNNGYTIKSKDCCLTSNSMKMEKCTDSLNQLFSLNKPEESPEENEKDKQENDPEAEVEETEDPGDQDESTGTASGDSEGSVSSNEGEGKYYNNNNVQVSQPQQNDYYYCVDRYGRAVYKDQNGNYQNYNSGYGQGYSQSPAYSQSYSRSYSHPGYSYSYSSPSRSSSSGSNSNSSGNAAA